MLVVMNCDIHLERISWLSYFEEVRKRLELAVGAALREPPVMRRSRWSRARGLLPLGALKNVGVER